MNYPTQYTDAKGTLSSHIENTFEEGSDADPLRLVLEGVVFTGRSFDDFAVEAPEQYTTEQLERFTLNKVKIWNTDQFSYDLCGCTLSFELPLPLVDLKNESHLQAQLRIEFTLGKPANNGGIESELATCSLELPSGTLSSQGDLMEIALNGLLAQFKGKYQFHNCFGCLYADYSPFGQGFFGYLMCFRDQKESYLQAQDKSDLFELADNGFLFVQETWWCDEYAIRKPNTGYRG